jgi:hypothetical protein
MLLALHVTITACLMGLYARSTHPLDPSVESRKQFTKAMVIGGVAAAGILVYINQQSQASIDPSVMPFDAVRSV